MTKAGTTTYAYDNNGNTISSTSGTTTTSYLLDGAEVIQEKVGTAAPTYYTRGLYDQLISRRSGTNAPTYYHHTTP